jgi:hypothetical protein
MMDDIKLNEEVEDIIISNKNSFIYHKVTDISFEACEIKELKRELSTTNTTVSENCCRGKIKF